MAGSRRRQSGVLVLAFGVAACNAVLGIRDLREANPAVGGAAVGGGSVASGGKGTSGSSGASVGGTKNEGGASTGGAAPAGGSASGGIVDKGGGGTGGEGGKSVAAGGAVLPQEGGAGGAAATGTTVSGVVVDFLGHTVPNAVVGVGMTTVQTDAQGRFSVPDVPDTYDITVLVNPSVRNQTASFTWLFEGLTRRDPTLQVYVGTTNRGVVFDVTTKNGVFNDTTRTRLAFGSPDGAFDFDLDAASINLTSDNYGWYGPSVTQGTLHALRWAIDSNELPTSYQAYYQKNGVSIDANNLTGELSVDFTNPGAVTPKTISGSVSSTTTTMRRNWAYLRFSSNATLTLLRDSASSSAFSYTVPTIADSVLTVAASEGDAFPNGPYAVVHKDVTPGQAGITLDIPTPAVLLAPTAGIAVDANTRFSWQSNAKFFVFRAQSINYYEALYVVTARKQITLPAQPGGSFGLRAGEDFTWTVETHGDIASVDDATGPHGYQDAFAAGAELIDEAVLFDEPMGATRGEGSCTLAALRTFKAK